MFARAKRNRQDAMRALDAPRAVRQEHDMKAITQDKYGPADEVLRLREVPQPSAGTGEVLVRVRATSVHADVWHAVNGLPYVLRLMGSGLRAPRNPIPGTDLSGEVIGLGDGTDQFEIGDRVFGEITPTNQWRNGGAFAQYAAVPQERLARIPAGIGFEQAASVPTAALIALVNLRDQGRLQAGDRVLVNGAGGSVGVFAVQLAKALGARVVAVDGPAKLDRLRELGADEVIDYTRQDFTRLGERFDIVFDVVSRTPFAQVREVLQPDGRFVLIGHDHYGRTGHRWLGSMGRMLPLLAVSPFVKQLPGIGPNRPRAENLATIVRFLQEGKLQPVVDDRVFPLEQAAAAIDYLTSGAAQGRVVLTV
jgi:NADPH:quinone reductase-like Zn-dependent oxidoreductase